MSRKRELGVICVAACAMTVASVAISAASDLSQLPGKAGCITESGASGLCQDGRGLVGTEAIALSPDGENGYVASSTWNTVSILTRDPGSGTLGPLAGTEGCISSLSFYPDCATGRELGGAHDVAVSPDGKNVYATAPTDGAVVVLDRDPLTGALSQSAGTDGCVNQDGSEKCADGGPELANAGVLAISPDGKSLYVASSGNTGGIVVFDRDPTSGDLLRKPGAAGCVNAGGEQGCTDGPAQILDPRDVAVSQDGETVYVVARVHDAVTIYDRAADGTLTPKPGAAGCIDEAGEVGCQDGTALIEPDTVIVSPDDENVYVGGSRSDSVVVFDRSGADGGLTQKPGKAGCVSNTGASDPMHEDTADDCVDGTALDGIDSLAVSPDGNSLYAAAGDSSGIDVFERHADGTLTQRPGPAGCITETGREDPGLPYTAGICTDGAALNEASGVVVTPDSERVYSTARNGGVGLFAVVEPGPPAAPADTVTPAPQPGPALPSLACTNARRDLRHAKRALQQQRSTIRHLTARSAGSPAVRGPLKKHRSRVREWRKRLLDAEGRAARNCS